MSNASSLTFVILIASLIRMSAIHPATFSKALIRPLAEQLTLHTQQFSTGQRKLLDPFGGLGHGLVEIAVLANLWPTGVEIEPGYLPHAHPCIMLGDSTCLPFADSSFAAAVTSPVYPNGMADDFQAKDGSERHTYPHRLRKVYGPDYRMHPNNAGGMSPRRSPKALARFLDLNCKVYGEVFRVLRNGSPFVVNTKNTLKVPFTKITQDQLAQVGFEFIREVTVDVPGMNHGKNQERKETFETISVVRKP